MRLQAFLALLLALTPALADGVAVPGVPRAIGLTGKQGAAVKYAPGPGAPVYSGPGEVVVGAQFYVGLRAYNAAYAASTGKAVNLRRASDNTQCDFNVASTGDFGVSASGCSLGGGLTSAAFATQDATASCTIATATATCTGGSAQPHVGSTITGSGVSQPCYATAVSTWTGTAPAMAGTITLAGGNGVGTAPCGTVGSSTPLTLTYGLYISNAYEQTGSNLCAAVACNMVQATAAKQPQLLPSCPGSKPCMSFVVANAQNLGAPVAPTSPTATATISSVAERTGNFSGSGGILGTGNTAAAVGFYTANTVFINLGTNVIWTAADSAAHALQFVTAGASSFPNIDGVSQSTANIGANNWSQGAWAVGTFTTTHYLTGYIWEVAAYPVNFTSGQLTSMCHNQFTYWGTPTSC